MKQASWAGRLVNGAVLPSTSSTVEQASPVSSPESVPSVVVDASSRGGLDVSTSDRLPMRRRSSAAVIPAATPDTSRTLFSSRRSLPHTSLDIARDDLHFQTSGVDGAKSQAGFHSPTRANVRDPLISLTSRDLRRPSFEAAGPGTSLPRRSGRRIPWKPLLRALKLASLAALGIVLFLRLVDLLRPLPFDGPSSSSDAPRGRSPLRKSRPARPSSPSSSADHLVLHPTEVEYWQQRRKEWFWRKPKKEEKLDVVVIEQEEGTTHEATVIYLTGLGQSPDDDFLPDVARKANPNVRWVVPVAPKFPVTVSNGTVRPGWFDIQRFPYDPILDRDHSRLFASVRGVNEVIRAERTRLIRGLRERGGGAQGTSGRARVQEHGDEDADFGTEEEKGWASRRIVVTGFSQGGVVALLVALTHERMLGGAIVLSGYLPVREDMSRLVYNLDRRELPIFWAHGEDDIHITYADAVLSAALLSSAAITRSVHTRHLPSTSLYHTDPSSRLNLTRTQFRSYAGLAHATDGRETKDLLRWLEGVLPKGVDKGETLPRWDG